MLPELTSGNVVPKHTLSCLDYWSKKRCGYPGAADTSAGRVLSLRANPVRPQSDRPSPIKRATSGASAPGEKTASVAAAA